MTAPTLHLTNWSSRKLHGPGRRWSIMAKPRRWEHGDGTVSSLCPAVDHLEHVKTGVIDHAEYERLFRDRVAQLSAGGRFLVPGYLFADGGGRADTRMVRDGDTLCCACSVAAAKAGHCHRVWAADLLRAAGWAVILDGEALP